MVAGIRPIPSAQCGLESLNETLKLNLEEILLVSVWAIFSCSPFPLKDKRRAIVLADSLGTVLSIL